MNNYLNKFYFLFPLVSVYIVSLFFPVTKNAGKTVAFRPPPYVFAIVWPILLILIGYSWTLRPTIAILYFIVFNYSKRFAFLEIIITLGLSLFLYFYKFDKRSSYLLIPLILWLAFASVLNYYSI
jgi:tryptophan-rich sensory protein